MKTTNPAGRQRCSTNRVLLLLCCLTAVCNADIIKAHDSNIQYTGRFDLSHPNYVQADWPGVRIAARFSGSKISMLMQDGYADYVIYIDGKQLRNLSTKPAQKEYPIADDLSAGEHDILVIRKNEAQKHAFRFHGFRLGEHGRILPPNKRPGRHIEFIGASYTAGYGNESTQRECTPEAVRSTTNIDKAFGSIVARHFDAEPHFEAWGGKGIVRVFGSKNSRDENAFLRFFPRTLASAPESRWDFNKWQADYVVIQLGGNDFSTRPFAEEADFITAYHTLLNHLFYHYRGVKIVLLSTGTGLEYAYKQRIVSEQSKIGNRASRLLHLAIPQDLTRMGCHWHPTISDHERIADIIINGIESFGEWQPM